MSKLKLQVAPHQQVVAVFDNVLTLLGIVVGKTTRQRLHTSLRLHSLAALSTALRSLRVDTLAVSLAPSELETIPFPCVAHLHSDGGRFVVLTKLQASQVTYHDPSQGWITEAVSSFCLRWAGTALLLEASPNSGDPQYEANRRGEQLNTWRVSLGSSLLLLWLASSLYAAHAWRDIVVALLLLTGLGISSLLVATDWGSPVANSVCNGAERLSCRSVLNSPAASLFGWLKVSEGGIVWFLGTWLCWWLGSRGPHFQPVLTGLALGSILAAGYAPFSIGYQWLRLKQWCPLCVAVQGILVGTAVLLLPQLRLLHLFWSDFQAQAIIATGFALALLLWLWARPVLRQAQRAAEMEKELTRFRTDTELFQLLWMRQAVTESYSDSVDLIMGSADAPLRLLLVANPFCEPCAKAHDLLEPLLAQMKGRLSITIRFITQRSDEDDSGHQIALRMLSLNSSQRGEAIRQWFRQPVYAEWIRQFPTVVAPDAEQALLRQQAWTQEHAITQTPTILLNGRRIPTYYKVQDLAYHLPYMEILAIS